MKISIHSEKLISIDYGCRIIDIETDNPEEASKLFRCLAKGNRLEQFAPEDIDAAKAILAANLNAKISNQGYKIAIYGIDKSLLPLDLFDCRLVFVTEVEKAALLEAPAIFVLKSMSIKRYLDFSVALSRYKSRHVVIVELDGVLLITASLTRSHPYSLECVIRRWIESNRSLYAMTDRYNRQQASRVSTSQYAYAINLAISQLEREYSESDVYLMDACTHSVTKHQVLGIPRKQLATEDIMIYDRPYPPKQYLNGNRIGSIRDSYYILERYVGQFCPVVEAVDNGAEDKVNMTVYQSRMASNPLETSYIHHGGKGLDYLEAKVSAVAEAIERYSARMLGNEKLTESSYYSLSQGYAAIDPQSLVLDPLYPYPYSPTKLLDWVAGVNLSGHLITYIPANSVFFVYSPIDSTKQFIPQSTCGLASGRTIEEAVLQGVCEIVERDSYVIYYRQELECSGISVCGHEQLEALVAAFEQKDIRIHIKYLMNDSPVYVMHVTSEDMAGEFPVYTHGTGASLNPVIAVRRALTEVAQLRVSQAILKKNLDWHSAHSSKDPYLEWGNGEKAWVGSLLNCSSTNYINIADMENRATGNMKSDISLIVSTMKKVGVSTYAVNLSREDTPLKTVRIIMPGMQPMDDSMRRISERMFLLPKYLGYSRYHTEIDGLLGYPLFH
jgi:thiazole/oxazole-forming peptide maturase SagD family component